MNASEEKGGEMGKGKGMVKNKHRAATPGKGRPVKSPKPAKRSKGGRPDMAIYESRDYATLYRQ